MPMNMRRLAVTALKIVANLAAASVIGLALLTAVYLLPVGRIEEHVRQSAETMQREGDYPVISAYFTSRLDNYTDSLMLNEAAYKTEESALQRALLVSRGSIEGLNPNEALVDHYMKGKAYESREDYARYWHGYLVLLKPLLLFLNYDQIRIANGMVQLLLLAALCCFLLQRKKGSRMAAYVIAFLMLMPLALAASMQFSSCWYVSALAALILAATPEERTDEVLGFVFLNAGIATAYFDFLTYPAAAFGIPAVFYLALRPSAPLRTKLVNLVRAGLLWGIGYAGMWGLKWAFASLLTQQNVVADGLSSVVGRASSNLSDRENDVSGFEQLLESLGKSKRLYTVTLNLGAFTHTPVVAFALAQGLYSLAKIFRSRPTWKRAAAVLIPYLLIGLTPFAWYMLIVNHSFIHFWMTNKSLAVTLLALLMGLAELSEQRRGDALTDRPG